MSFFSTGLMQPVEGGYELVYTSDEESPDYEFVVITEETVVDEIPEALIIEGLAQ